MQTKYRNKKAHTLPGVVMLLLLTGFLLIGCGRQDTAGTSSRDARYEAVSQGEQGISGETEQESGWADGQEPERTAGRMDGQETGQGARQADGQESGQSTEQADRRDSGQSTGQADRQESGQSAKRADGRDSEQNAERTDGQKPRQSDRQNAGQAVEQEPEQPAPDSVTLLMVGDILLHTPVEESALQSDGSYDFSAIFANVKNEIQAADVAIVNQEVILGGEELGISGYPAFNAPYEAGDALVDAGFDVVCHATNHALDKGKKGLLNCMDFWQENYPEITVLGVNDSGEDQDVIYVYEQNGIRIAILNYTYGTNGIPLPADMPYGVNLLERERVEADLQRAEEIADFTVVCPHWGTEYELGISGQQQKWTEIFRENGADLILGTHPHVIEPIEWVTDAEQEEPEGMLVYYSLGNFVNWTSGTGAGVANRMVGGMAQVTVERNEDGEVCIADYGVIPLVCHLEEGTDGVTVYALSDYTEELAQRNAIVKQDPAFSLEYCRELCEKVWGNSFVQTDGCLYRTVNGY